MPHMCKAGSHCNATCRAEKPKCRHSMSKEACRTYKATVKHCLQSSANTSGVKSPVTKYWPSAKSLANISYTELDLLLITEARVTHKHQQLVAYAAKH